ncbi:MAG: hypothetical protein BGO31_12815 [Bacteroidetes bacterium 43-16]|nr:MAG: hypothetical protein BGO31_12815 [Bacteroidetes bacterium 43-16]
MNENITGRIIQYLQVKSNYAIILSGEYGIGKTHFLKTVVFPKIEEIPIQGSDKEENKSDTKPKNYKTIHVSLFGVKSIEDIQRALFLEIYPWFKSKTAKVSKGILKSVGQFFSVNIEDFIDTLEVDSKKSGFENLLICIDDIDRKNKSLDLSEVYGYINNLVENLGAKIIMIANEDLLRKEVNEKGEDLYSTLREKVIGITIPFLPDTNRAFDQIVDTNYKLVEPAYSEFLKAHQQEIVNAIDYADYNLRNLLFFLEHFKVVFKTASEYFEENPEVSSYVDKLKKQLLSFTLPISIEYKLGNLTEHNIAEIQELYTNDFGSNLNSMIFDDEETKDKSYGEVFSNKYFKNVQIEKNFIFSVLVYILGKDEFTKENYAYDIEGYLRITNNQVPASQQLIMDLSYWSCVNYSEVEYREKTENLIEYIKNGDVQLDQYITAFHYATRFENLLEFDLETLKEDFINSIHANIDKFVEYPNAELRLGIPYDTEFKNFLIDIKNEILSVNDKLHEKNIMKHWQDEFLDFKEHYDRFLEESKVMNSSTSFIPYLSYFPEEETADFILKLPNSQIVSFSYYIRHRYKPHSAESLFQDSSFLSLLKSKVNLELENSQKDKIDKKVLNMINQEIDNALIILAKYQNEDNNLQDDE